MNGVNKNGIFSFIVKKDDKFSLSPFIKMGERANDVMVMIVITQPSNRTGWDYHSSVVCYKLTHIARAGQDRVYLDSPAREDLQCSEDS